MVKGPGVGSLLSTESEQQIRGDMDVIPGELAEEAESVIISRAASAATSHGRQRPGAREKAADERAPTWRLSCSCI